MGWMHRQQIRNIESILTKIDSSEVINKISVFRRLNINTLSDEELFTEIQRVLLTNNIFTYVTNNAAYARGTLFFRIRKLNSSVISEMNFKTLSDFWEPPVKYVDKKGRLNKVGESLLYTSPIDPVVPIKEVGVKDGEWYALIKYTAIKDIKVNIIGGKYDYKAIGFRDDKAIMIHELFNSFLRDEFSRYVEENTEYLYRISERIAKDYFDLPSEVQDAWCYASVQDKQKYNVCFRPEKAHDLLRLNGALICKMESDGEIRPRCVAIAADKKAHFFQLGTVEQKEAFPEILLTRKGY